ncbi:hypothetical protein JW930_06070 [Candidatus Woesearchaeota archaeon]|nr:hypothetical protein [Candidatus Woesearchaeota archaeon]
MKKRIIAGVVFLLFIMLMKDTLAFGISPGIKEIEFEPNIKQQLQFTIHNTNNEFFKAVIYTEGELAEYITLHDSLVSFTDKDEKRTYNYEIDFPADIGRPGIHETKIIVMEIPEENEAQGTFIGARVAVISKLKVRVPYPGKYAEATLRAEKSDDGGINFFVELFNYGEEDISDAKAAITIIGPTNERIATIHSNQKPVNSKAKTELVAKWVPNVGIGKYHAEAIINYDDRTAQAETDFLIGEGLILIKELNVNNFQLGQIAKLNILLENAWTDYMRQVTGEVVVRNDEQSIASFKIHEFDIAPLGEMNITSYWDTQGIEVGKYYVDVVLNYADKVTKKTFDIMVSLDRIDTIGIGRIIGGQSQMQGKEESIFRSISVLTILVVLLIIFNIYFFYKLMKNKKS